MANILASISVVVGAELNGFKAKMAEARRELRGLVQAGEAMKNIGTSLTQYVTLPLAALGTASVLASGKIESLRNALGAITTQELGKQGVTGLGAVAQAAALTADRMKELQVLARAPGLGFEQAVQGDVRLRAVGISAEQSAKSLKAFANAIALTGGGKAEFNSVTVQLAQMSAKSKVLAQDLRPIIEAAPAVAGALQKMFNTVDSEEISKQLQKAGQSSTDFIVRLTEELGKLPQVAGGLKNSFENLGDSITLSLAKTGDTISKALNLPALLNGISDLATRAANAFAGLSPEVQRLAVGLAVAAAAAGPLLFAFGAVLIALPSMVAGFGLLTGAVGLSLGPIALGAAAVAAAAYLIIDNWSALTAYFGPAGEGGRIFSDLADSIGNSVSQIASALGSLSGQGTNLGDLISATGILKSLFEDLAVGVTAFSNVVGGAIGAVTKLLQGDFTEALAQVKRAVFGLIDPLAHVLGFTKQGPQSSFDAFFQLSDALKAADEAALSDAASTNENTAALQANAKAAGLLAVLEERLKAAREARPALTTEAEITTNNRLTAGLEAQIKRLNELGIAAKRATEAIDFMQGRTAKGVEKTFQTPEFKLNTPDGPGAPPEQLKTLPVDTSATEASLTKFKGFMLGFKVSLQAAVEDLSKNLAAGLSGVGQSIATALANGTSVAEAAGNALLRALGEVLMQFGEKLLLFSLGNFALGNIPLGVAQAAAGTALVAGGAFVGAQGQQARGGGANTSTNFGSGAGLNGSATQRIQVEVVGTLKAAGSDLSAVLKTHSYRQFRTT